jgi:hypothetical protein
MSYRNLFSLLVIFATVGTTCSMRNIYNNQELYPSGKEISHRKVALFQKKIAEQNLQFSSLNKEALVARNQNINDFQPTKLSPKKEAL